jgi:hypothetical protein
MQSAALCVDIVDRHVACVGHHKRRPGHLVDGKRLRSEYEYG